MGATFSKVKTVIAGETITASDRNSEFDNILNNLTPTGMDDNSATATTMRVTVDPYPSGTESLATSLQGELERLRYVIGSITGLDYWYSYPSSASITASAAAGNASLILADATSAGITVTLRTAVGCLGHRVTIKKTDSTENAVILDGSGSQTIDGELLWTLSVPYECITIVSDNSNWKIVSKF